jgi:hypothetical protein
MDAMLKTDVRALKVHQQALIALEVSQEAFLKRQEGLASLQQVLIGRQQKMLASLEPPRKFLSVWRSPHVYVLIICSLAAGVLLLRQHFKRSRAFNMSKREGSMLSSENTLDLRAQIEWEQYDKNRKGMAVMMLVRALPVLLTFLLGLLVIWAGALTFYIWGWVLWSNSGDEACDASLREWLALLLSLPILWVLITFVVRICIISRMPVRGPVTEENPIDEDQLEIEMVSARKASTISNLIWLGAFVAGDWRYMLSWQCATPDPYLYQYLQVYVILLAIGWVLQFFMLVGFVELIFWLHSKGFLDSAPTQAKVGMEGLVDEVDHIVYDKSLFTGAFAYADQCCLCQTQFQAGRGLKRTACEHVFHEDCLGSWLSTYSKECPICRLNLEDVVLMRANRGSGSIDRFATGGSALGRESTVSVGALSFANEKMFPAPRQ